MPTGKSIYKVIFANQDKVYEIYARHVSQSSLFGFVEIEGVLFGEKSSLVVDPSEERLKAEFAGVNRFYVPMHSVIRIDEMDKHGTAKISDLSPDGAKVTPFPTPFVPPGGKG